MQTTRIAAVVTAVAVIALAVGTLMGLVITSGQMTTTEGVPITITSTATVVALSTRTITRNVTETIIMQSAFYQPCKDLIWNNTSEYHSPYLVTPVLLMRPNSTGYVCVVYQSAWKGNSTLYDMLSADTSYPFLVNGSYSFQPFEVYKIVCVTSNQSSSCDYIASNSFRVSAIPTSITASASTNYVTVVYAVTAMSNATGFYDQSAPRSVCLGMPIAVGYASSQVNSSDFTEPLHSCIGQLFEPAAEFSTGMNVTLVGFDP